MSSRWIRASSSTSNSFSRISERRGVAKASRVAQEFVADDGVEPLAAAQDVEIVLDLLAERLQLVADLVAAERGQALQAEVQDGAGLGLGEPVLIDYVPLLDHPLYFAGLLFLASGITLTIFGYVKPIIMSRKRELDVATYGMLVVATITIVAFLSVFFSAISNGASNYRALFWGPGHIIQFANTLAMVVVWFILLEKSIESRINKTMVKN